MEILIGLIIILALIHLMAPKDKKPKQTSSIPKISPSRGDYESHLDFLEMHGALSSEDREKQRELEKDLKKNPQNYTIKTLQEMFEEYGIDSKNKSSTKITFKKKQK